MTQPTSNADTIQCRCVTVGYSCWISLETGLLWSFVGPLIVICLVTAFFCRYIISASYLSLISLSSFKFKMSYSGVVYDFLHPCTTCFEIELSDVTLHQVMELVTWCGVRARWSVTDGQAYVDLLSNEIDRGEWMTCDARRVITCLLNKI